MINKKSQIQNLLAWLLNPTVLFFIFIIAVIYLGFFRTGTILVDDEPYHITLSTTEKTSQWITFKMDWNLDSAQKSSIYNKGDKIPIKIINIGDYRSRGLQINSPLRLPDTDVKLILGDNYINNAISDKFPAEYLISMNMLTNAQTSNEVSNKITPTNLKAECRYLRGAGWNANYRQAGAEDFESWIICSLNGEIPCAEDRCQVAVSGGTFTAKIYGKGYSPPEVQAEVPIVDEKTGETLPSIPAKDTKIVILECLANIDCSKTCENKIPTCLNNKCYCDDARVVNKEPVQVNVKKSWTDKFSDWLDNISAKIKNFFGGIFR